MVAQSKLTQKGQVLIPKEFRDHFGLEPYDNVSISLHKDGILLKPQRSIRDMVGFIKTAKKLNFTEIHEAIEDIMKEKYGRSR